MVNKIQDDFFYQIGNPKSLKIFHKIGAMVSTREFNAARKIMNPVHTSTNTKITVYPSGDDGVNCTIKSI